MRTRAVLAACEHLEEDFAGGVRGLACDLDAIVAEVRLLSVREEDVERRSAVGQFAQEHAVHEAGATFEFRIAKKPGSAQLELIKGEGARAKGGKKFADLLWPERVLFEMKSRSLVSERAEEALQKRLRLALLVAMQRTREGGEFVEGGTEFSRGHGRRVSGMAWCGKRWSAQRLRGETAVLCNRRSLRGRTGECVVSLPPAFPNTAVCREICFCARRTVKGVIKSGAKASTMKCGREQRQRRFVLQPRVRAKHERLPWERIEKRPNPNGVVPLCQSAHNPVGVGFISIAFPG